jgi:hypothetical protein
MKTEETRKCDDPFWDGCKEPAMCVRERRAHHRPDAPMALCATCWDWASGDVDEWEIINEN